VSGLERERLIGALVALQRKAHDGVVAAQLDGYMAERWRLEGRADGHQDAINLINQLACCEGENT
jgi:hypothetical protein